jgi:hypothetical protein
MLKPKCSEHTLALQNDKTNAPSCAKQNPFSFYHLLSTSTTTSLRIEISILALVARFRHGRTGYGRAETTDHRLTKHGMRIKESTKFLHYSFFRQLQWG